jgi:hypothetical protein
MDCKFNESRFGYISRVSGLEMKRWIPYFVTRGLRHSLGFKGQVTIEPTDIWPFEQQFDLDVLELLQSSNRSWLYVCVMNILKPEYLKQLKETVIPSALYKYKRFDVPLEISSNQSQKNKQIHTKLINIDVEMTEESLLGSSPIDSIRINVTTLQAFKSKCRAMLRDGDKGISVNVTQVGQLIVYEVLLVIETRLGPDYLVMLVNQLVNSNYIDLDPIKGTTLK